MCGIFAVWSPAGGLSTMQLESPLAALRHRGPDGTGGWCSPGGQALLGHTRLAVIDLQTGDQPIGADDGLLQIVVNGEFYGYKQLRAELARRGRTLRTSGDSEVALHLYALDAERALARLRGEFAFVIWDERRGQLLAARDRFGIKPLYYAEHAGRLYLASEVKALLAAGVPARWNVDGFADHLQVSVAPDQTLFAGVRQLPPGCLLTAGERGARVTRYWDLGFPRTDETSPYRSLGEYLASVEHALTDAVLTRTVADVPVGYHLSGGLDSSSVVAIAARQGPATAFTVQFDDPAYDESEIAARTAKFLDVEHHQIPCRRGDFADEVVSIVRAGETIQENSHGVARYIQSAGIRGRDYKVAVAGEGGDELFAGYPQFQRDLMLTMSEQARTRAQAGYAKLDTAGAAPHLRSLLGALGFIPTWVLDRYMNVTMPIRSLLRGDFAERLAGRDACADTLAAAAGQLSGRTFFHQSLYLFAKTWLCNYILAAERLDMAHGLEVRLPLLDHQLFEVVRSTPPDWYTRDEQTKFPLRAVMRAHLPAEVLAGRKRGFFAPPVMQDDTMLQVLRDLTDETALRDNPFFDPAKVRHLLERATAQPRDRRWEHERLMQIVAGTVVLAREFRMSTA
jgi:asparagine synthase (glutamine-hydrolysing)